MALEKFFVESKPRNLLNSDGDALKPMLPSLYSAQPARASNLEDLQQVSQSASGIPKCGGSSLVDELTLGTIVGHPGAHDAGVVSG